jgi:hypothetical protein
MPRCFSLHLFQASRPFMISAECHLFAIPLHNIALTAPRVPYPPPMAPCLFRIGTTLALAAALAPAGVSNRDARSEPRSERRDQGRPAAHALRTVADRSAAADPIGAEYTARVVGIADGDTIRVLHETRTCAMNIGAFEPGYDSSIRVVARCERSALPLRGAA